jgi:hypothetical protein
MQFGNSRTLYIHTYIGTIQTNKTELRPEIAKRITYAKWAYYAFLRVLQSQRVLRAEKIKMYKTLIRPVATEGTGSWTLA